MASGSRDNDNGLYLMDSPQEECLKLSEFSYKPDWLWHCHLGQLNFRHLESLIRTGKVQGLPNLEVSKHTCEACQQGKECRHRKPKGEARRMEKAFELLHTNLCGPILVSSTSGSKYIQTFTNYFTC